MNTPKTETTTEWMSIYIPCIPHDLMLDGKSFATVEDLTVFFQEKMQVGSIKRIDLITKPRGNTNIIAAFVHFDEWFGYSTKLREYMITNGDCKITGYFNPRTNISSKFYSSQNRAFERYLTFKINKNPIPEIAPMAAAELNVEQLVNSLELARETIAKNELLLSEQAARIAKLEEMLRAEYDLHYFEE
jgi:hypothetical protein